MHIAQNWRIRQTRYALKGVRCETCGTILFPARAICPHCEANPVQLPDTAHEKVTHASFGDESHESMNDFAQAAR